MRNGAAESAPTRVGPAMGIEPTIRGSDGDGSVVEGEAPESCSKGQDVVGG